ncbi:MAG: response regulator [Lentisphaeraceae bacterium]|nr:response regulator [Lentisphaeraceae bacterium]
MMQVLFIDKDQATLNAVKRNFTTNKYSYELITLEDPEFGFQKILEHDVKIVVAEISLGDFHCKTFFEELKLIKPSVIRISLTDDQSLMDSFNDDGQTHITFNKPINTTEFFSWIDKLVNYRLKASEELISHFFENVKLKSYPENILKIVRMLNDEDFQMSELAKAINIDTNLKVKLLKFVNSSLFGFTRRISDIKEAIEYLGVSNIKNVVKYLNVFSIFEKKNALCPQLEVIDFLFDKKVISRDNVMDLKFAYNIRNFICSGEIEYDEDLLNASLAHIMHVMMVSEEICEAFFYSGCPEDFSGKSPLLNTVMLISFISDSCANEEYLFENMGQETVTKLKEDYSQ